VVVTAHRLKQVSVGIENIKDIIADFEEALKAVP
jgi:O-acetylhomoserine/O-acetylserine sulfhydrylase-like pyridoxal-dependent enzyme